jgi:hypothetical protein
MVSLGVYDSYPLGQQSLQLLSHKKHESISVEVVIAIARRLPSKQAMRGSMWVDREKTYRARCTHARIEVVDPGYNHCICPRQEDSLVGHARLQAPDQVTRDAVHSASRLRVDTEAAAGERGEWYVLASCYCQRK